MRPCPFRCCNILFFRYARKLFLHNSSLSNARLHNISIDPESRLCFADLSLCIDDKTISSYASHLKELRFATEDDLDNSFAHQAAKQTDKIGHNEASSTGEMSNCVVMRVLKRQFDLFSLTSVCSVLPSPFRPDCSVALLDYSGTLISCHKPDDGIYVGAQDENNNSQAHDNEAG